MCAEGLKFVALTCAVVLHGCITNPCTHSSCSMFLAEQATQQGCSDTAQAAGRRARQRPQHVL